jgi:hypothetical protein
MMQSHHHLLQILMYDECTVALHLNYLLDSLVVCTAG